MLVRSGLIFAMKARYSTAGGASNGQVSTSDTEALYIPPTGVVDSAYSGSSGVQPAVGTDPFAGGYQVGTGLSTLTGEGLTPNEMGFTIDKVTVTAITRALKSEYTIEMAQDLKAVHGLDAESELSNILSNEIMFEINREVMGTIYGVAKNGAQKGTTTAGTFDLDTDSDGRWSVEDRKSTRLNSSH